MRILSCVDSAALLSAKLLPLDMSERVSDLNARDVADWYEIDREIAGSKTPDEEFDLKDQQLNLTERIKLRNQPPERIGLLKKLGNAIISLAKPTNK